MGTILGGDHAVVGGLCAIAGSLRSPGDAPGAFVGFVLAVARRAISRASIDVARCVVTRFGLSVTLLGRDVALLRSQPGVPAPDSCQLVGSGILPVPRGVGAILGGHHPVVGGQRAVARGLGSPRGASRTFIRLMLAVAEGAIFRAPVQVAGRVVTCLGFSVTQFRRHVALVRGQVAVTPFDVAGDRDGQGVLVRPRGGVVQTRALPGALPPERLSDGFRVSNVARAP